jgi:multiple sugar transport system ATP-binding protein
MSDIVLKEVSKSYGAINVLDKVSMHIASGEFIVFLGPSGLDCVRFPNQKYYK